MTFSFFLRLLFGERYSLFLLRLTVSRDPSTSIIMVNHERNSIPKIITIIKAKVDTPKKPKPRKKTSGSPKLSHVEQAFLGYLRRLHYLGIPGPFKLCSVAQECGHKNPETRSFRQVRKRLKDAGLIQENRATVQLTLAGVATLPKDPRRPPETNWEFHDMVKQEFKNDHKISHIIDALADGGSESNQNVANLLGYKNAESRGFRRAKTALKELNLLEGTQILRLTNIMFPFGRPKVIIV